MTNHVIVQSAKVIFVCIFQLLSLDGVEYVQQDSMVSATFDGTLGRIAKGRPARAAASKSIQQKRLDFQSHVLAVLHFLETIFYSAFVNMVIRKINLCENDYFTGIYSGRERA